MRVYLGLVVFSVAGSALTRLLHLQADLIAAVASALTIGAGAWTVVRTCRPYGWPLAAGLFGAAAEIVGLATGFPFGRYEYTRVWQPALFFGPLGWFPLLLPLAWLMVAGAAERLTHPLPAWIGVPLAAALAAGVDLLMEPAAAGSLNYWRWLDAGPLPGGAPWANLFGWFGVSAVGATLLRRTDAPASPARREAAIVLGAHLLMLGAVSLLTSR